MISLLVVLIMFSRYVHVNHRSGSGQETSGAAQCRGMLRRLYWARTVVTPEG